MSSTLDRAQMLGATQPPQPMLIRTLQQAKRIIKVVVGFTILLAGVVMLVTPGPGLVVIAGGLAILAVAKQTERTRRADPRRRVFQQ